MGSCEETKACEPEKSLSLSPSPPPPPENQPPNVHAYPDWTTMQAYYGPRMALPPYYHSAVAPGHAPPPYMWAPPQHMMMPPYAAAAMYPHGVPLASPMNIDSPAKSSGNTDRGLMKKLKGFDGLAMSLGNGNGNGNGNGDSTDDGTDNVNSHCGETEGSSEGSDGNTTEGVQNSRKRSREYSPNAPAQVTKTEALSGQFFVTETPSKVSDSEMKKSPTVMTLFQNERELKRERRKQSNRESARRSRLRKQAEAEELAIKVEALTSENLNLKSEINRLTDKSEKLKYQNASLTEKLKNAHKKQDIQDAQPNDPMGLSLSTVNLISRVNNGSSLGSGHGPEVFESNNNHKSGAKLRQLLNASPRTDAVTAN